MEAQLDTAHKRLGEELDQTRCLRTELKWRETIQGSFGREEQLEALRVRLTQHQHAITEATEARRVAAATLAELKPQFRAMAKREGAAQALVQSRVPREEGASPLAPSLGLACTCKRSVTNWPELNYVALAPVATTARQDTSVS